MLANPHFMGAEFAWAKKGGLSLAVDLGANMLLRHADVELAMHACDRLAGADCNLIDRVGGKPSLGFNVTFDLQQILGDVLAVLDFLGA
ncbi:hypothetical protein D3C76_1286550 [compost metagenome]